MLKEIFSKKDPIKLVQSYLEVELREVEELILRRVAGREEIIEVITDYTFKAGGKRLRPILTLLSSKLFGYNGNSHINLAAAIELIHTATILHDDVVDHSLTRRGRDTVNQKWDNKISILVGDFLFSQAFCLMAEEKNTQILSLLAKTSAIIAEGEVLQIKSYANFTLSLDEYLRVIEYKTSELFAAACEVGALIAGKGLFEQQLLRKFGLNLGLAFQMIDDLLDYADTSAEFGKEQGTDFKENKITIPIILLLAQANEDEKKLIEEIFLNHDKNNQNLKTILDMIKKYRIFAAIELLVDDYINAAKKCLDQLPQSEAKEYLYDILEFSAKRKY
jgi:octaprenyl-diphosphate synthase